jgi:hypothetical protein
MKFHAKLAETAKKAAKKLAMNAYQRIRTSFVFLCVLRELCVKSLIDCLQLA